MLRSFPLAILCLAALSEATLAQVDTFPVGAARQNALPGTLAKFQDARSPITSSMSGQKPTRPERVTRKVDLSETVKTFAAVKKLSISQARLEAFMFLGLVPRATGVTAPEDLKFKKVATDVFEITGRASYFHRLPAMQRCLELGKKRVRIHVNTFAIAPSETEQVTKLITPGTLKVHYDRLPHVTPVATNDESSNQPFEAFVSTSTITRQNIPVTTGHLSEENRAQLQMLIQNSPTASVLSNPILSALPGQAATISDMSYQPFVVGAELAAEADGQELATPTIQTVEQGTTVRVKALPSDGQIQLMTDIAISRIMSVDVFQSPQSNSPTTVQVPSQRIRQVHLASLIEPGTTVLIDANLVEPVPTAKATKRGKSADRKFLVTLRAQIVDMDDDTASLVVAGHPGVVGR